MLPETLATGRHQSAAAQVSQVARDLGLAGLQGLDEIADADLAFAHEIEQAQACTVSEGAEQSLEIEGVLGHMGQCENFV